MIFRRRRNEPYARQHLSYPTQNLTTTLKKEFF